MSTDQDSTEESRIDNPDRKGLWLPFGVLLLASLVMLVGLFARAGKVTTETILILAIDGLAILCVLFLSYRSRKGE